MIGRRRYGRALYVSRALFEAVFGPIGRDEGNVKHAHGRPHDLTAAYEGWDRKGGRWTAPQGRRAR